MGGRASAYASELRRVVRETLREVHDENITFMAGSIAYHAFVSLLPLLLLALVVLSIVDSAAFTAALAGVTEPFLTPYARELVVGSLDVATAQTGVSVVGAATLLWGMSKIFRGLDVAFSEIYGTKSNKPLLAQFENAVVVFTALGVATVVFLAAAAVVALVPTLPYRDVLNPLFLVVGLTVAFFPVYYVFPDADVTPAEVLPGAVFAAVGWGVLEAAFQAYVTLAGRYEAVYGALGSAFILLIWLYFGGLVLLVGAVLNAVLAGRTGDEHALGVTDDVSADPPRSDPPSADVPPAGASNADARPTAEDRRPPSVGRLRTARGRDESCGAGASVGRVGDAGADLRRADRQLDADTESLRETVAQLEAENDRLVEENDRLRRRNDALALRLRRQRRSVWARTKRWLFRDRE
ncbi:MULTISPECIES: YhjD/YihY/BrkB family envelope integrity protein [Halorussus]|uniref:YhjD/YihY/BrkB family envelope integrity protein n=1 Tax=Halorussus TaxID=1070314 RepID=UPI001964C35C|nr:MULTISPECIES: YhjD/YihY/BrkB family envelope integrity protein [Halorussus]